MMFLANGGGGSGGGGTKSSGGGGGSWFGGGDDKAKSKDPADLAKQWKRDLQKEIRRMDRDINDIKRSEQRSMAECRALAKKGRLGAVKILAKEVANTRRTVERMYVAKAQLNSVSSTLTTSMCKSCHTCTIVFLLFFHSIRTCRRLIQPFLFMCMLALMKMQGCMTKSAEIMTAMNKLVNISEIRETMQNMAREMERVSSLFTECSMSLAII